MNKNTINNYEFTMCNPLSTSCKCPQLSIDKSKDEVRISDDYNSSVRMTVEQFESLKYFFTNQYKG